MSREVFSEGVKYLVPDDMSDDDAAQLIVDAGKPATNEDVIKAFPRVAENEFLALGAGAKQISGDITAQPDVSKSASEMSKYVAKDTQDVTPRNMNFLQEAGLSAAVSTVAQMPTILAATGGGLAMAATGVPQATIGASLLGLGTSAMGAQTGIKRYGEMRAAGFNPMQSAVVSAFDGFVEKFTEYYGLGALIKGTPLVKMLKELAAREIPSEEIATTLQDMSAKVTTRPDMTLGDYMHDVAITALATAIQVPVQAGAVSGISRAAVAAYAPFIKPENVTAADAAIINTAALATGAAVDPNASVAAVLQGLSAQAQPQPTLDVMDLALPDKVRPAPEGALRVYAVVPAEQTGTTLPDQIVWTSNLEKVQQQVDMMGSNVKIAYVNLTPADIRLKQETPEAQAIRVDQQVTADDEYVLPSVYVDNGTYLYSPPSITAAPTIAPPAVEPAPTVVPSDIPQVKPLNTLTVKINAVEAETGKKIFLEEKADRALFDIDEQHDKAEALLECLRS